MYRKCQDKNFNQVLTLISGCERQTAAAAATANTGSLAAYLTEHKTELHVVGPQSSDTTTQTTFLIEHFGSTELHRWITSPYENSMLKCENCLSR